MAYILKNTSALINTRLTDTARLKLSQGNFNISYFQVGDSEISYNTLTGTSYNQSSTNILEPNFNSQNSAPGQTNKQNVKYPIYVDQNNTATYGIPTSDPAVSPIYNRATMRGFFSGDSSTSSHWSAYTDTDYVINSNYVVDISTFTGGTKIKIIYSGCNYNIVRLPSKGDFITIYYDGNTISCGTEPISVTPTHTPTPTPTPSYNACALPLPTPTPSSTCCVPTPTGCTPTPVINTFSNVESCYNILTYKIVDICLDVITLDRVTPNYSYIASGCTYVRTLVYPPNMTSLYDTITPTPHWNPDVINFESICNTDEMDVKVWNMNIPWSENPAGLIDTNFQDYTYFGSKSYIGTKEYLGYMSNSGQTFVDDNGDIEDSVYYYDSFNNKIVVEPKEQKAIAIIHYTNNTIDFFYGEKFALEQPIAGTNPIDVTGDARNFKLHLPWLIWHKNPNSCSNCVGETFYVYPPQDLLKIDVNKIFKPHYIKSNKNSDMNMPGIRYYMLWDSNPNAIDGRPNRVGKVFPDQKIIVIDDEELIAALSYKSNRNWTLPAATTSLIVPNSCNTDQSSSLGVLTGTNQTMYVSYLLTNTLSGATNSLHCNYYSTIIGPNVDCGTPGSQNVAVRFNGEFNCLNQITNHTLFNGFVANQFKIICQIVENGGRPESDGWVLIDFTNQLSATTINGFLTQSGLTNNTFVITEDLYNASILNKYDLNNYISLPTIGQTGQTLNFGDEYYFYGSLETDIQATIYEMRYKINLGQAEFQHSSNPSWSQGLSPYISEIGLYDSDMNLMIVSKLQSPVQRQGLQQFLVKFDF
jgi:hypothetical protein